MHPSERPLISETEIAARVGALAQAIGRDYAQRELVLVAVLKGAAFFAVDLMRRLPTPVCLEFMRARSYAGVASTGTVHITFLPEISIAGRHVLVVDDILDTGRTTAAVLERLRTERPASLALCVLLDKPARREVPITTDYVGFTIDNHFVVGYGLDHDDRYRQLSEIHVLEAD